MSSTAGPRWGPMALAAACLVVSAACGSDEQAAPTAVPARAVQELALLAELQGVDSGEWISIYDPQRAWNGYTLGFYRHRTPILFDMNGRIVHSWPEVNLRSRLRLLTDGSLLGISTGIQLMTREVGADDEQWQEASFDLGRWEYQKVELCVQTTALGSAAGQPTAELAFWSSPRIASRELKAAVEERESGLEGLTPEEIEVRRDHLKAMGYLN